MKNKYNGLSQGYGQLTDREFALEAVNQLIPDTQWEGKTPTDEETEQIKKDVRLLEDMANSILWELRLNSEFLYPHMDRNECEVARAKQQAMKELKERFFKDEKEEKE